MPDFLSSMAASSLLRADGVRASLGVSELERRARSARPVRRLEMSEAGFDLIAETKLASPSEGRIAPSGPSDVAGLPSLASAFVDSGAAALSVLTEPSTFDGDMEHLETVADAVQVPVMRKDFLVDPIQVLEARAAGASGVLLIARMLDRGRLAEMTDLARDLAMFVLIEVFEAPDLEIASAVFDRQVLVGVNSRDLETLEVDKRRHEELISHLPPDLPAVAESGLFTPSDVEKVAALGYRLALVGSSLMTSRDPGGLAGEMIAAGRGQVARVGP